MTSATTHVVTRLRLDAALYEPAPERVMRSLGRPRKKGRRWPTLAQVVADPTTRWQRLTVIQGYGEPHQMMNVTSATAVWFHSRMPPVMIRWVLIRDPERKFKTQALLCTHPQAGAADIVQRFVQRRQIEVTFEEARAPLGVETQRQWSKPAIVRTTPLLLALFSLATLIADRLTTGHAMPVHMSAWYRKTQLTFSDALALVCRHLWASDLFQPHVLSPTLRKLQTLCWNA